MDCGRSYECKPCMESKCDYSDQLKGLPLAIAYVPWQQWREVMDADQGLKHGTIFKELVLSFYGEKAACQGSCNYHQHHGGGMNGRRWDRA